MPTLHRLQPCLWFDTQAEEAARFYTGIFPNSTIGAIARYPAVGQEIHGKPAGSVLTVEFVLDGHPFTAMNGGPLFKFNEAVSLQVMCATQEEIDHYWAHLAQGGEPRAQQCGWLKDRYGVSWQVVPRAIVAMMADPDPARVARVFEALLPMHKLDLAALQRAYEG